jgi:hypothetical protein
VAIDTDNEKFALIDWGNVWMDGLPISSDGLDQADNQQLLWEYPGLLWTAFEAASRITTVAAAVRIKTVAAVTRVCSIPSSSRTFTPADD